MTTFPLIFDTEECLFRVHPHFRTLARNDFINGETYRMEAVDDRNMDFHRAYFATVNRAWGTLHEDKQKQFPTPTMFRQWALIKVGYYRAKEFPCENEDFAKHFVRMIARRPDDEDYSIVKRDGDMVRVFTARSQKVGEMKSPEFDDSANKVLNFMADQLGVTRAVLDKYAKAGET